MIHRWYELIRSQLTFATPEGCVIAGRGNVEFWKGTVAKLKSEVES
jgi:hypothetical protein